MTEFSRYSYFSGNVDKIKIAYVKFLHDLTTQKLLKSVHFWQSYRRKNRMACFWDMVYMSLNLCIAFSLLCLFEIFKADWLWQASSLLRLIVRTGINTPWVKKNKTPNSSLTIFRFSKFFTTRLGSKFATNSCLNIPPRFKHVATLPCKIWMQKNGIILKYVLQLMMNHKIV